MIGEEPLPGGFIAAPVRIGDTVRKAPPKNPGFVHGLLRHLASWGGAPRFLGIDEHGRAILEHVDGEVPWQRGRPPDHVRSEHNLRAVGRMIREFHDLTAGTPLAGEQEVVCHHDLSPKNTVYREREPVAFIDWDDAAPGRRVQDVAHACWQFVGLGPAVPDPEEAGRLVWAVADGYRLGDADRAALVDTVLWWQESCWRGILAGAEAGQPAMIRLCELGAADEVRAALEWTRQHSDRIRLAGGRPG